MQPNQQNQDYNQPQQPNSLPYQVPDYLQIEPVPDPTVKRKKIKRIIFVLFIILLLVGSISLAYLWFQGDTERSLYDSMSRSMQTKYYKRNITITYKNENRIIRASADTDFGDIASPKSSLRYNNSVSLQQGPGQDPEQFVIQGSQMISDNQKFFERIDDVNKVTKGKFGDLEISKWYGISSSNSRFNSDAKFLKSLINSPLSVIPLGNKSESQKNSLIQKVKDGHIYQIAATGIDEIGSRKFMTYDIETKFVDIGKVYENSQGLLTKEQIDESVSAIKMYSHMKLWVDKESRLITKTIASTNESSAAISTYEVNYEYPDNLSIVSPKDVTNI